MRAKGLLAADRAKKGMSGTSDPYVVVHSTNGARAKTSVKKATINPEWDETLEINVYDAAVPLLTLILALILTPALSPTPTLTLSLTLTLIHPGAAGTALGAGRRGGAARAGRAGHGAACYGSGSG